MTKKKQQTTQAQNTSYNNATSYGWMAPPDTSDVQAARDFEFTADPSAGYNYGVAKDRIANTFNNPLGGVYTPQMRDSIQRSQYGQLAQAQSQATSEANQTLQGQRFAQRMAVAGMTAPRMVQTGSSGTSSGTGSATTVQSGGLGEMLLTAGATGAAA